MCKKLRGLILEQRMADQPQTERRLGWAFVFTCLGDPHRTARIDGRQLLHMCPEKVLLYPRTSFKLRCDRGSNFIGAKTELDEALTQMNHSSVERYLSNSGCAWQFNPPQASHFGGVWEGQIGTIRRTLDAMLLEIRGRKLTHELLVNMMSQVAAIVNKYPITAISARSDCLPLTPLILLTQKIRPLGSLPGEFGSLDLYARRRWRKVQYLAD